MAQWCPLEKDDAQCSATLEAAFAFIDAFNEELRTDETNGSLAPGPETLDDHTRAWASDPLSPSKPQVSHCGNHDDNSRRKDVCNGSSLKRTLSTRRKSPDAGNTMRVRNYRRRNKAEIQELRTKVARMEAQLTQLQSRASCQQQQQQDEDAWLSSFLDNLTAQPELQAHRRIYSASYSGVHSERKKRLQSESTNRQLKQIFFALLEMGASVDKFFHMNVTAPDMNALFGIDALRTKTFTRSPPATADTTFLDLHQDLECVYVSAKVKHMLNPAIENACSSSQVRVDTERGPVYEFSASTPLQCRFQALDKHLNSHMDRLRRTTSLSTTQTKSGCKTVAQTHFTTVVSSPHYGQFYLDGVSVLGKYDEVDRSVIACTSRFALRGTGLVFHEKSYLAFVNGVQAEDSSPSSLCQIDYHIFAVPEIEYYPTKLRDFVLTTQWRRMQAHQLEVQNVLLHELDALVTEGKPRSQLLVECPVRHMYSIC